MIVLKVVRKSATNCQSGSSVPSTYQRSINMTLIAGEIPWAFYQIEPQHFWIPLVSQGGREKNFLIPVLSSGQCPR
jgi:hypothetical protein